MNGSTSSSTLISHTKTQLDQIISNLNTLSKYKLDNNVKKLKSGTHPIDAQSYAASNPDHKIANNMKKINRWVKHFEKTYRPTDKIKFELKEAQVEVKKENIINLKERSGRSNNRFRSDMSLDEITKSKSGSRSTSRGSELVAKQHSLINRTLNVDSRFNFGSLAGLGPVPSKRTNIGNKRNDRFGNRTEKDDPIAMEKFRIMKEKEQKREMTEHQEEAEVRKKLDDLIQETNSAKPTKVSYKRKPEFKQTKMLAPKGYSSNYKPILYHLTIESERKEWDHMVDKVWEPVTSYNTEYLQMPKTISTEFDFTKLKINAERLFTKTEFMVGILIPNIMNNKKKNNDNTLIGNETSRMNFGFIRKVKKLNNQKQDVLVSEDTRFVYPKEYSYRILIVEDYDKRYALMKLTTELLKKEGRNTEANAIIKGYNEAKKRDDFNSRYEYVKKVTEFGISEKQFNWKRSEIESFEKTENEDGKLIVDHVFYHENEIIDYGCLGKNEIVNSKGSDTPEALKKSNLLNGAKVKFRIVLSSRNIKPEAVDITILESATKNIDETVMYIDLE